MNKIISVEPKKGEEISEKMNSDKKYMISCSVKAVITDY